jgi:hypothetical protein
MKTIKPALNPAIALGINFISLANVLFSPAASAEPTLLIERPDPLSLTDPSQDESNLEQVTSVSQLTDVKPTDWAFQALQSLVERYGCIVGYPDRTFRGNRALSRYEFAAGLNACLDKIQELIAASTSEFAKKEDLEKLKRLMEEFASDLAALRGRVESLEVRTATLEKQQFSTTTKLSGQAIFGVQGRTANSFDTFGTRFSDPNTEINFVANTQLSLFTQFSPESLLLVGLQAGNGGGSTPSLENFARLGYLGDTGNTFQISDLTYRQLIGSKLAVIVGAAGVNPVNVFRGVNRIQGAGFGSLSLFAQRNPIINIGGGRTGIGLDWQLLPEVSLQAVYAAGDASNPGNGLFGGQNGETVVGAQVVVSPIRTLDISLQYLNAYSPFGNLNTGVGDDQVALLGGNFRAPIGTNAFGATVEWRAARSLTLGGWVGYTTSTLKGRSGSVETLNWMAFLNFPDLFGQGNLAGIYVGQPPRITSSTLPEGSLADPFSGRNVPSFINQGDLFASQGGQPNATTHLEFFYRLRVNDNISITPGVIFVFNPGHNAANETITIGAIRTTFSF